MMGFRMPWVYALLVIFTLTDVSEALHHHHRHHHHHRNKNLPSVVVVGTVYCDTCFLQGFSKSSHHFIPGATVAVECGETATLKPSFREEVKTDEKGEFRVNLPFSVSEHVKSIKGCKVTLIRSSEPYCSVASTATASSIRLKSKQPGTHIFSAGFFTFKPLKQPEVCSQKPSIKNSMNPDSLESGFQPPFPFLPPTDQSGIMPRLPELPPLVPTLPLPRIPGIPLPPFSKREASETNSGAGELRDQKALGFPFPPNPFFPPPLLPPNPLLPPPSLVPPILPSPPPSLFPPVFPSPPPSLIPPVFPTPSPPPSLFPPLIPTPSPPPSLFPPLIPTPSPPPSLFPPLPIPSLFPSPPPPPPPPTFPIPLPPFPSFPPFPFQPTPVFPGVPPAPHSNKP